jgi:NAD(P)-dependent dehydrogenase (short-subunit alcohol dehydrogenase family)
VSGALAGRTVVVTGAGGGLGPLVARRLADAGARIVAADVDAARLAPIAAELGLGADRWRADGVDLLDEAATRAWADEVESACGGVDAVLHLVGGWRGGKGIAEADLADWDWLHDGLVRTLQHVSRAFLGALERSGRGRFAIVSSPQAQRPSGTNAAYGAAKAAAEAWTLALAEELGQHGGAANIVVVNAILTPQMREANPEKPYRTFTPAEHIAEALTWLLTDAAERMNGQRLALHG